MEWLQVSLDKNSYPIYIAENLFQDVKKYIQGNKWMLVTDINIWNLYGEQIEKHLEGLEVTKYVVEAGEESKNLQVATEIIAEMLKYKFTRQDKIIALGGGVIGDLAGFCASIYMRGVSFMQIPTTLLAQIDSSVGGKTGVNLPEGKNVIGAFHQPESVLIDTSFLKTLPNREIISGLGEVIKYGIIYDYAFFQYVSENLHKIIALNQETLPHIIKRCCEIKADIVSQDEMEKGIRKILNFGHTIGHAIETATKYRKYTHGEAVIIGMYYEAKLARNMGLIDSNYYEEINKVIYNTGVNLDIEFLRKEKLITMAERDKKNKDSKISFILPVDRCKVQEYMISPNSNEISCIF